VIRKLLGGLFISAASFLAVATFMAFFANNPSGFGLINALFLGFLIGLSRYTTISKIGFAVNQHRAGM